MTASGALTWLLRAVLFVGVAFAAYRIIAITQADRWASEDPERALGWVPRHPQALLTLAERQLTRGDTVQARATARRLLAVEPLEGRGFRVLAAVAAAEGRADKALELHRIAARRSPRDLAARAWLAEQALRAGDYAGALEQIDVLLRVAPGQRGLLLPMLVELGAIPGFADALAAQLESRPQWRGAALSALQGADDVRPADRVMSGLRNRGGLTDGEFNGWIDALMRRGDWDSAYGRWASTLDLAGAALPLVYNGDFERPVSGRGFDWRVTRIPGVSVEFVPDAGATGIVAHVRFRQRPVAQANLEQPLLLAPGSYTFQARMRADALRSELGLEWTLGCRGQSAPFASSARIDGSFPWRTISMDVDVPATGCQGQWLRLRNPVPGGSAQLVSGDLWFDDVVIDARR